MTALAPRYLHGTVVLGAVGSSAPPAPSPESTQSQWEMLYNRATGDLEAVDQAVRKVHARISPWLWIFSIWGAFGTTVAVWNKAEQLRDRGWRLW